MVMKTDWDDETVNAGTHPDEHNLAAEAINALPDNYVSVDGSLQEITASKVFANNTGLHFYQASDSPRETFIRAGYISLESEAATVGSTDKISAVDFYAHYWTTSDNSRSGTLGFHGDADGGWFQFSQPVRAGEYQFTGHPDAYVSGDGLVIGDFSTQTASLSPYLLYLADVSNNAEASLTNGLLNLFISDVDGSPFTEHSASINMRSKYWDGAASVTVPDGSMTFKPNAGNPYFQFNQPVQVTGLQSSVYCYLDAAIDYKSFAGIAPGAISAAAEPATSGEVSKMSSLYMQSEYWDGDSSESVMGVFQFQPNAGDPYFEFNKEVRPLGTLTVLALGGEAGYSAMYGNASIELVGRPATEVDNNVPAMYLQSTYWSGSASVAQDGYIKFQPNDGSPYFEFDKSVKVSGNGSDNRGLEVFQGGADDFDSGYGGLYPGQVDIGSPALTGGGSNGSTLSMNAHWYDTVDHNPGGSIHFQANSGDPYFTFSEPVGVTGTTGATLSTRVVGGTASGAPTTGTFQARDMVTTTDGHIWVCTAEGTPGTWRDLG